MNFPVGTYSRGAYFKVLIFFSKVDVKTRHSILNQLNQNNTKRLFRKGSVLVSNDFLIFITKFLLFAFSHRKYQGASIKDVCTLGREGVSNNVDKSGQGDGGGLAVSGHPVQYGQCMREENFKRLLSSFLPKD